MMRNSKDHARLFSSLLLIVLLLWSVLPTRSARASLSTSLFGLGIGGQDISQTQQAPTPNASPSGVAASGRPGVSADPTDRVEVMIELDGLPVVQVYAQARAGDAAVTPRQTPAARELQALQAAQAQLARVEQAQQTLLNALSSPDLDATVINRLQKVYNGIAVQVEAGKLADLRKLPGVKAIHPVRPVERASNAGVPFIGTPSAWTAGPGARGEGIKLGIIDDGIDYLHRNFGGPGSGYANNNRTVVGDAPNFPGVKVAGGFDFVGDDYDATSNDPAKRIPHPDPDPMDCGGHGTATASIAAGYGVNTDGSTYTGPYDTLTPFSSLKIGPGVAPAATLYALKVFDCHLSPASAAIIVQAIEWSVDPNDDGDLSDRLDVINLSLAQDMAVPDSPLVIAANNAVLAGVIVVASAGNRRDTNYITAAPASAGRAISVAASAHSGSHLLGIQVNSPASIAGQYQAATAEFGPPLTAAGITGEVVAAMPANGCTALTNPAAVNGKIALVDEGGCSWVTQVRNAQAAGAVAVIVVSTVTGWPRLLYNDGTGSDITIPAVKLSQSDGASIKANLPSPGVNVTLSSSTVIPLADTLTDFTSRGPRAGDSALKPDIAAPGFQITGALVGTGTGAQSSFQGTSFASPFVAGGMALLRQMHPNWSVEELKALVMNTATFDLFSNPNFTPPRYAPARVGAGRVALQNAVAANVIAYNADDPGFVSVSFGAVEVVGTAALTKNIRLVNKGAAAVTYNLSYDGITDVPGVSYSFPGGTSVNVPAGGITTFQIRLEATAAQMKHTRDASLSATDAAGNPRHWLSEESGYIKLTPASGPALRVPVYATARPASVMGMTQTQLNFAGEFGHIHLNLTGQGVHTGTSYPTDITSLVSLFELQEISPDEPWNTGLTNMGDLKYVGINTDFYAQGSVANTWIFFGLATHGPWPTPNLVDFQILIDTNLDGVDDYLLSKSLSGDVFFTELLNLATGSRQTQFYLNAYSASEFDTVSYNTNVAFLLVSAAALGLTETNARFSYQVKTFDRVIGWGDTSGRLTYDVNRPGLNVGTVHSDQPGKTISLQYNRPYFQANASRGLLLLHHHNVAGSHDQVLLASNLCKVTMASSSQSFDAHGGTGSFLVTGDGGCGWRAVSNSGFITITSPPGGSGNGNKILTYSVQPNTTSQIRSGTFAVAGQLFTVFQGLQFNDVPAGAPFYTEIGKLSARAVTLGCGSGNYCPDAPVTREQMAAFIIRALGLPNPPQPATQRFADVPSSNPFYAFIEQMALRQITLGCGGGNYCPTQNVTREQIAAFLIRALHAPGYVPPPPATQRFADVPSTNPFYAHIEEMAVRQITLGCGGGNYCPSAFVTRGQMAAFLVRAFGL
jgi:hypothetical protein